MILHILSLMRWEWFKLRHRWMPWVLLTIFVLFTQLTVWIPLIIYKTERGDVSDSFVLPDSLFISLTAMFGFAIVLMVTLASSIMGAEYGWGTLRTVMARGPGRWQFLVAKFAVAGLAGLGGLMIAAIGIGISSLAASGLAGDVSSSGEMGGWSDVVLLVIKAAYALTPYILLAIALTVFTSSATVGLAITMGYHIAEQIAVPVLTALVDGFDSIAVFALGINVHALISDLDEMGFIFMITTLAQGELPGTGQASVVVLVYSMLFGGAALWLFHRRDITGAKGT